MRDGKSPTEACQIMINRIKRYYPTFSGAIIAVNKRGEYGAAYHNVPGGFPFCYQDKTMNDAQVFRIHNNEDTL
jgi:hypothetical protein